MARSRVSPLPLIGVALCAGAALALAPAATGGAPGDWSARSSEGVTASSESLGSDAAQRLSFDFRGGAGFALMSRALPLEFPSNYAIHIDLRTSVPGNAFEIKFVDGSGDNVWWYRPRPGQVSAGWQTITIRRRQLEFAWGPTSDRVPHRTERIEVVANAGGAPTGSIDVGRIALEPLPPPPAVWPAARAHAEPADTNASAAAAIDGDPATSWTCAPTSTKSACVLTIDYAVAREFGGLRIDWGPSGFARGYEVGLSDDGEHWRSVARVGGGGAQTAWLWLGECESRFIRVTFTDAPSGRVGVAEISLLDVGIGADRTAFIAAVAAASPRGEFPRGFTEQSYWTLVGRDGGSDTALLSEDGALELGRGAPAVEPFVQERRTISWADAGLHRTLDGGYAPIPSVEWTTESFGLAVTAVSHQGREGEGVFARYQLVNRTDHPLSLRLFLVARPYQVNPPAQFLTTPGGVSPIRRVDWDGHSVVLDGQRRIVPLTPPSAVAAFPFEYGHLPIESGVAARPPPWSLTDAAELASAVLRYDVDLAPHGRATFGIYCPWTGTADRVSMRDLHEALAYEHGYWRERLNRVAVRAAGSAEARDVTDALRAAHAHVLLSRAGALLRPGTRAYARSWIRDGAMMSDALLRLGDSEIPRRYLAEYARYVSASGRVPCCVDERGADPVPEHDSPGEFIHLAAAVLQVTGDVGLVRSVYPQVKAAVGYIARLREQEAASATPLPLSKGLLPPSISHEGYSAKPMHSYWDDFWALRGLADAADIATRLGEPADAAAATAAHDDLGRAVLASITATEQAHGIDFIPGCADLGDFDATSTTIALDPGIGATWLPPALLLATFDRYWAGFVARRDGTARWNDYTPYEWRVVGTFIVLAQPERALTALRYFMGGRRPAEWQQWPEVIDRSPRHARFIGDLPHGWVASDFIRSTVDLFAFDRESDAAVVLAAGVPSEWLAGDGVEIRGLQLRAGALSYRARTRGRRTVLEVLSASALPPGGFVYRQPAGAATLAARVDSRPARFIGGELRLSHVPVRVTLEQL